jgi:hypothetical protein
VKPTELLEQGRFLGEEFLLWLWMRGLTEGGTSGQANDVSACFVDDAIELATERGDVKELSLRKGNPAESREAMEALARGMRPTRAKIRILAGDMEWTFSLVAVSMDLSGLKLPPSQAKDPAGRIADRLFLLEEGVAHLERRYQAFLDMRATTGEEGRQEVMSWIRSGLAEPVAAGADDLPWEG